MNILDLLITLLMFYSITSSIYYRKENKELRKIIYSKDNFIISLRNIIESKNKEINSLKEGK